MVITMKTYCFTQTFSYQKTGKNGALKLTPDQPTNCSSREEAMNKAERLADKRDGVIAAMQEFDESSSEYGQFTVLAKYGNIPSGALREE